MIRPIVTAVVTFEDWPVTSVCGLFDFAPRDHLAVDAKHAARLHPGINYSPSQAWIEIAHCPLIEI
jgi:hypothetical protein